MKGILEFDLPEDRENFEGAQKWWDYKSALDAINDDIFRPIIKYGVSGDLEDTLLGKNGSIDSDLIKKIAVETTAWLFERYVELKSE